MALKIKTLVYYSHDIAQFKKRDERETHCRRMT